MKLLQGLKEECDMIFNFHLKRPIRLPVRRVGATKARVEAERAVRLLLEMTGCWP